MAYGTLARVKELLGITDTSQDTELTNHLASADADIDAMLGKEGLVVPGTVPTIIAEASAYLAASQHRRERLTPGLVATYREEGERKIMLYIRDKTAGGVGEIPRESI